MRVLVVGQGLAGTLVSHAALDRGWDCHVMDSGQPSASAVAAGMYNPMSFRRIVEVWDAAEHLASMRQTYTVIETLLGDRFLHPLPILKRIPQNRIAFKSRRPSYDTTAGVCYSRFRNGQTESHGSTVYDMKLNISSFCVVRNISKLCLNVSRVNNTSTGSLNIQSNTHPNARACTSCYCMRCN